MSRARGLLAALSAPLLAFPNGALAFETAPLAGRPALVEVTESVSVIVNANNRNTRNAAVASVVDDDWVMTYNRLHGQATWDAFHLELRLDSAYYLAARSPSEVALLLLERERRGREGEPYTEADGAFFVQKFLEAGDEMNDRFVDWTYPSKYGLSYETSALEATLGDFYAQYGQGLVLSVRKQDELSSDTTIRGARLIGKLKTKELRLRAGALAGTMNPLRIDDASGRNLAVTGSVLSPVAALTEAGMPRAITNDFVPSALPNYAPDHIVGLELEGRSNQVGIGVHGVRLMRSCLETQEGCVSLSADLVRSAHAIDTGGVFVDLPRLGDAALYVEYAHQRLSEFQSAAHPEVSGDALYGRVNWLLSPVALTLEGRHYRSFYPLRGNVDVGRAREFTPVQYSAPPTSEDLFVDTQFEEFNTCVTGGRAQVDIELSRQHSLFAWVGRHDTWGESSAAGSCDPRDDNLNRVWDFAQGAEMRSASGASHGNASLGARFDGTDRTLSDASGRQTDVFYRELYLRHDITVGLSGPMSLQFQAWHRRRRQTLGGPETPWLQGQTVTALQLDRHWNLAFGFEYDENPAFPDLYFNGQLRYDFEIGNVALFTGQRQGGLRCVSGICRVFPPFEGGRVDVTVRF